MFSRVTGCASLRTTGLRGRTPACSQQVTDYRRNIPPFNKLPLDSYETPVNISGSQPPFLKHKGRQKPGVIAGRQFDALDTSNFQRQSCSPPSFWINQGVEPEMTASNQGRHSGSNLLYKCTQDFIEIAGPDDSVCEREVIERARQVCAGRCACSRVGDQFW